MIDKDKKYTARSGAEIVIIEIFDGYVFGRYKSVTEWQAIRWDINGNYFSSGEASWNDLIEVSPYIDWRIDDKFLVWKAEDKNNKKHRHYAGLDNNGIPLFFSDGRTSWSTEDNLKSTWDNFEKIIEDKL